MTNFSKLEIEEAIKFIEKMGLGSNLISLALTAGKSTQTFNLLAMKMGLSRANDLFIESMENVLSTYQREWDKKMALAYLNFFTLDELRCVSDGMSNSQAVNKFNAMRIDIGNNIQCSAKNILSALIAEILAEMIEAPNEN